MDLLRFLLFCFEGQDLTYTLADLEFRDLSASGFQVPGINDVPQHTQNWIFFFFCNGTIILLYFLKTPVPVFLIIGFQNEELIDGP